MPIKYIYVLFVLFFAFASCEETFFPEIDSADNLLVIDGRITDAPGPYTIRLNTSSAVYIYDYPALSGATVTIFDDTGNSEILIEKEPGVYTTKPGGIRGIPGRSYKVEVSTSAGKNYASDFEELLAGAPIEDVYVEVETKFDPSLNHDLVGYQFYLDGGMPEQKENYYLYELEATYKYQTDHLINFVFQDFRLVDWPAADTFHICYRTFIVQDLIAIGTNSLASAQVKRLPLHYEDTEDRLLAIRYSLNTKQLSISAKAFEYWSSISEQISEQGTLYSRQPFQIRGNLRNVNDFEEPILGYFTVAGISEKRIFVDPPDEPFYFENCVLTTERLFTILGNGDFIGRNNRGELGTASGGFCLDCREADGTIIKPDFWME